jgi:hypothetical protein
MSIWQIDGLAERRHVGHELKRRMPGHELKYRPGLQPPRPTGGQ